MSRPRKGGDKLCKNCGCSFYCLPCELNKNSRYFRLFCSQSCSARYNIQINGGGYNKNRKASIETRKKMSETHKRIGNKPPIQYGSKNNKWKGGIYPEHLRQRKTKQYFDWRNSVYSRDNYTCVLCGLGGGWNKLLNKKIILNADHIKPFSLYPELRFSLDNGRTLCYDCHREITKEQLKNIWKNQYNPDHNAYPILINED